MTSRPCVSFILPIHNAEPYLAETLASLFAQTLTDFEIIAINDGSTDATPDILHTAARNDSRLRIIHRKNKGLVATLNEAIDLARANYLARIDADDICLPHRLAVQRAYLDAHPEIAVLGSAIETFSTQNHPASPVIHYPPDPAAPLLFRNALAHPAVMMRKNVLDAHALRYQQPYRCAQDYDLWCRCIANKIKIANLPDVLTNYRLHAGQITQELSELMQLESEAIRPQFLHDLGLAPTPSQCHLHNAIASDRFSPTQDFVNAAAAWLAAMATRPELLAAFDRDALLKVLTGRFVSLARFAHHHHLPIAKNTSLLFAPYLHPGALDPAALDRVLLPPHRR